jgi:hypothetical protein
MEGILYPDLILLAKKREFWIGSNGNPRTFRKMKAVWNSR